MNVLVTGSAGFIGKNLIATLERLPDVHVLPHEVGDGDAALREKASVADFVFHLAGVNRPRDPAQFSDNASCTEALLRALRRRGTRNCGDPNDGTRNCGNRIDGNRDCDTHDDARNCGIRNCGIRECDTRNGLFRKGAPHDCGTRAPVWLSSSMQAELDNPYGASKREAESLVFEYARETGAPVYVYRLANVFGKWCRPGYNSVVATFCHNLARGLPIEVRDECAPLSLLYIDDLVAEMLRALRGERNPSFDPLYATPVYGLLLGNLASILRGFAASRQTKMVPDVGDALIRALYATYQSYLPPDGCDYTLARHADARGSFTEMLRSEHHGQLSVNVSAPGMLRGNHWHHTKHEKFLVVSGRGMIRLRALDGVTIYEYEVSGESPRVVDIPPGYTHNIENLGQTDMITVMWASECFDPARPDTYALDV